MVRGCRHPAAPHRWLAELVARRGEAVAEGVFRLTDSQAALAADAGCSAGTIQARIRLLEQQGLVLSRRPLTVCLPVGLTATARPRSHQTGPHLDPPADQEAWLDGTVPSSPSAEALPHLLAANASVAAALAITPTAELIQAQQVILSALAASRIREPDVADPREIAADPRLFKKKSVSQNPLSVERDPTDSLTSSSAASRIRETATATPPRIRDEPVGAAAEIDQLVEPLAVLAERCGLIGVTDRRGLHDALSQYSHDQIRYAVSQVARMTKGGQTRSPLGWLISAARRGDPDLFRTSAREPPPAEDRPTSTPQADSLDIEAEQAVAAAGPAELARLDEQLRKSPHYAPILSRIFSQPPALHAARLQAWRALQEVS